MSRHRYDPAQLEARRFTPEFRRLLSDLCARTALLFEEGKALIPLLDGRSRRYVSVFSFCGARLLDKIEQQEYNVFDRRPILTRRDKLAALWMGFFRGGACG